MGLAGRKVKQRISRDPNNLVWSNDTSKFGFKMLEKMGWAPGKGLGKDEQGAVEHLKVSLKEDQLGIGADEKPIDNWILNSSGFEDVLKRLNDVTNKESELVSSGEEKENRGKKRKRKDKKEKKEKDKKDKEKKSKKAKKAKKAKKKATSDEEEEKPTAAAPKAIRLASRSRFLRNKRVNNYSAKDLAEILGVRGAAAATTMIETKYKDKNTTTSSDESTSDTTVDLITSLKISQISTTDYFAAKLKHKSGLPEIATVGLGMNTNNNNNNDDDWDDTRPAIGLGF